MMHGQKNIKLKRNDRRHK